MLLVAREQEEQLDLERRAFLAAVERLQERVLNVLENLDALEPGGEQLDERGLADADRALDGDVASGERYGVHSRTMISRRPRATISTARATPPSR